LPENLNNPSRPGKEEGGPSNPERRIFIKKGAEALLGAAVALYLPGEAFGSGSRKKKGPEKKSAEKKNKLERIRAEVLAEEILRVYNSPAISCRFDSDVFAKNFVIAQQYEESRYRADAESDAEAVGVYQVKPEAICEVIKFLSFLRGLTDGAEEKYRCDYQGPDMITETQAEAIGDVLKKKKSDYGRAVGKLYLLAMHDKNSAFNNSPNRDVFRGKSPEEQQDLLLVAYHDGPSMRLRPERASRFGKEYVVAVHRRIKIIENLRKKLARAGLSEDLDYAIIKIMREMERKENRKDPYAAADRWIVILRRAQLAKWKKEGKDRFLEEAEIKSLFPANN